MVFHWSLSDSKSPQVSRTLLSILAVLNNAVVWMVSTRPPTSKSSSPFSNPLVTVPNVPIVMPFGASLLFTIFSRQPLNKSRIIFAHNIWIINTISQDQILLSNSSDNSPKYPLKFFFLLLFLKSSNLILRFSTLPLFLIWLGNSFRKYEVHMITFQTFFVWALLLIVHTWNSSPLRSNLLWLQYTCCTVPTTSVTPHASPLVWACQWPSSQPLSSPQLSHNDSLWA